MQERDVGPCSHLTMQKGDRMSMDIQSEVQHRWFRPPLQSATRSKRLRTNAQRRLRRDLCPSGKDDDGADHNCACRGKRVAPPPNGHKEHLSSRRARREGVHGTTTRFQLEHPSESGLLTHEATPRPQASTACLAFEDNPISLSNQIPYVKLGQLPLHKKRF